MQFAIDQALDRDIRPDELSVLTQLFAKHLGEYSRDTEAARAIQTVGLRELSTDDNSLAEHAAWTSVARVILNMHEVMTRQ